MKKLLLVFLIFILVFGLIVFSIFKIVSDKIENPLAGVIIPTNTPILTPYVADPNHKLTYSAWIPSWAGADGASSFSSHTSLFSSISPVWYGVNKDGSLTKTFPAQKTQITNLAKQKKILLIPTITMQDYQIIGAVFADPLSLQRHVNSIVNEVNNSNYDGIDLDYESTEVKYKDVYFLFLEMLSAKLKLTNKQLSVTVLSKWGDDITYPSLPQTRQLQDWTEIVKYADEIRIMAYDYTFPMSQFPGPIAPLTWEKQILDYAVTKIPRDKIVLGIHLYSYEWWVEVGTPGASTDALNFISNFEDNPVTNPNQARSYDYATVKSLIAKNPGTLTSAEGEQIYNYQKTNTTTKKLENRVLVFINPDEVKQREQLAKDYGLKGVVFWRLGDEADLLNSSI